MFANAAIRSASEKSAHVRLWMPARPLPRPDRQRLETMERGIQSIVRGHCMLLAVLPLLAAMQDAPKPLPLSACNCSTAKISGGWCVKCGFGFIAGVRIESLDLFEALDAHGHDIDPQSIRCPSCKAAMDTDGYCEKCHFGFVRKQAYLSRLTYLVAKGKPLDLEQIQCVDCRKHAERHGWCERCSVGMVGNVAFHDRGLHRLATKEYDRLLEAVNMLKTCPWCAIAMMTDGRCPDCKISFQDGKKLEPPSP